MSTITVATKRDRANVMIDEEGMSIAAASRELGVSRAAIAKWRADGPEPLCPECGIPMRVPARRCGFCADERELNLVAA